MPRTQDYDEDDKDDSLDEWETGDEADSDEPDLAPCPHCGKMILDDAVRCPKCGDYINDEQDAPAKKPLWIIVTTVLLLIAFALFWIF